MVVHWLLVKIAGFVKFVAHAKTDRLLGMHVIGPAASDIEHEGMIALEFVSSVEDLQLNDFWSPDILRSGS